MKLVEEWRDAWKWISTHAMVWTAAIQGAWLSMSPDMKAGIPESWVNAISIALLVLGVAGRLVKQTPKAEVKNDSVSDKPVI